jgi:hypothetical protein
MGQLINLRRVFNVFGAACALMAAVEPETAWGQWLEYRDSRVDGRVDNYRQDSTWRLGDLNGNGLVDAEEFIGPIIDVSRLAGRDPSSFVDLTPPVEQFSFATDPIDYPDFATIRVVDTIASRSYIRSSSVQFQHVLTFDNGDRPGRTAPSNSVDFAYGARFVALPDFYTVIATGGLLDLHLNADVTNQAAGPLVSVVWKRLFDRWQAAAGSSATLAYNLIDSRRQLSLGENLAPGGVNSPMFAQPLEVAHESTQWGFSPLVEVNVQLTYELNKSAQAFVGYDLLYLGDMRLGEDVRGQTLFDFRMADGPGKVLSQSTAGAGIQWIW